MKNSIDAYNSLINVYDYNVGMVDMAPIAHTKITAQIAILLGREGNFLTAINTSERVIIPCTAESECRTSGPKPHLIHDNMTYLTPDNSVRYKLYTEQLSDYLNHVYDPLGYAVYKYIQAGTLKEDVKDCISKSQFKDKSTVVFGLYTRYDRPDAFNATVSRGWIKYYLSTLPKNGVCSITGKPDYIPKGYPRGIMYPGDKAKLFSAVPADELLNRPTFTPGYIAGQKICHALQWLNGDVNVDE